MSDFCHGGIRAVGYESSASRLLVGPWLMKSKQTRSGRNRVEW
jgi:hypothetical protein